MTANLQIRSGLLRNVFGKHNIAFLLAIFSTLPTISQRETKLDKQSITCLFVLVWTTEDSNPFILQ